MKLSLFYFGDRGEIELLDGEKILKKYQVPDEERALLVKKLDEAVRGIDLWQASLSTYLILYNYLEERGEIPRDLKTPIEGLSLSGEPTLLAYFELPLLGLA